MIYGYIYAYSQMHESERQKKIMEECKMKECKHKSPIYVVKRLRLLDYLVSKKLYPDYVQPDATNPHFKNWVYTNTPELEEALESYFAR